MYYYDTCSLLRLQEQAFSAPFYVSEMTLRELENIKSSGVKSEELKAQARNIVRLIDIHWDMVHVDPVTDFIYDLVKTEWHLESTPDALIVAGCYSIQQGWTTKQQMAVEFVSDDLCCRALARIHNVKVTIVPNVLNIDYCGYREVQLTDDELAEFYGTLKVNRFNLKQNEYLIIRDKDGLIVDSRKWTGDNHSVLKYEQIYSEFMGRVKPRNPQQELCFDMLQDSKTPIKVITGGFGTGKDYMMLSHAIQMIEKYGKFQKIVWVRNNIEVKGTKQIGHLPGSANEKLMPYAQIISDHVGGQSQLEQMIAEGSIELCHLGFLRGRDIKNAIIYCSEAENLTKSHVQLLMGRVSEGSQLWLNGDYKQVDSDLFRTNNGLMTLIGTLAGHEKFGFVKLQKSERSEVAAMADLLD